MKIPKQFKLFGETIKVVFKDDLFNRRDAYGESHHRYNEIQIDNNLSGDEIRESTFLHELTHIILGKMNETELNNNERFVNIFSQLLYQALETMEY